MAVTTNVYGNLINLMGQAKINFSTDSFKCALLSNAYTPNLDTNTYWLDVNANEVTGTGYTSGGQAITGITWGYVAANSFATTWVLSTAYAVGAIIRPATGNGHLYKCVAAGTSAGTTPTFPTGMGLTVTDNTVTWEEIGTGITQFKFTSPSWATSTITAYYAVVYDDTPATAATKPIIGLVNFGGVQSSSNGTFTVTVDATGLMVFSQQQNA